MPLKKTKAKNKQKSDFYNILLFISFVGLVSYVLSILGFIFNEGKSTVPDGWVAYWVVSGLVYMHSFFFTCARVKLGAFLLIAICIADAVLPLLIFDNTPDGLPNLIMNSALAIGWIVFIRKNPKFLG